MRTSKSKPKVVFDTQIFVVNQADYLVSEDKDLLVLNPYQGVKVVNTLDFLHILQALDKTTDSDEPKS